MNHWTRDHGSLDAPSRYRMKCDVPGCTCESPEPSGEVSDNDFDNQRAARALAEANGWYVARDRGAVNQNWDLCPGHAPRWARQGAK